MSTVFPEIPVHDGNQCSSPLILTVSGGAYVSLATIVEIPR